MVEPEREPAPEVGPSPGGEPAAEPVATEPGAAPEPVAATEPVAMTEPAEPVATSAAPPTPTQTYELPTARRVVGSGLALAFASTSELRKASIYVGLLVLGAFGPALVALLLIVARLGESAGEVLGDLLFGITPSVPPAVAAALLVVLFELLAGLLLFVSISIDAQVIAIALLGARAGGRPMRLWESIIRARQAFWRMAGSGALVGIVTFFIQALIVAALGGFSRSDEAASVIGAIVTTVIVAPLAYVSTGIVLGDVGAMEAISRSWRLYRARRMLAVVVILFPLVTSAIHLFAFSAGIDLVARAAELMHLSLTESGLAFATAVALVLAGVIAYGSLSFTIGAVVAAPQVAGFLGLTFYSAGLDRARSDAPKPPPGFHYVSRPMLLAIVVLSAIVALQVPSMTAIQPPAAVATPTPRPTRPPVVASPTPRPTPTPTPRPPDRTFIPAGTPPPAGSGALRLLVELAAGVSPAIRVGGAADVVEDEIGDAPPADDILIGSPGLDLLQAEAAILPVVPEWLLEQFDCERAGVICPDPMPGVEADPFERGALLFVHRVNVGIPKDVPRTYAVLLLLEYETRLYSSQGPRPFAGASRVLLVTTGSQPSLHAFQASRGALDERVTHARAYVSGSEVFTLIPLLDFRTDVSGWDLAVLAGVVSTASTDVEADAIRRGSNRPMRPIDPAATMEISGG